MDQHYTHATIVGVRKYVCVMCIFYWNCSHKLAVKLPIPLVDEEDSKFIQWFLSLVKELAARVCTSINISIYCLSLYKKVLKNCQEIRILKTVINSVNTTMHMVKYGLLTDISKQAILHCNPVSWSSRIFEDQFKSHCPWTSSPWHHWLVITLNAVSYHCCLHARRWCIHDSSEEQCAVAHWSENGNVKSRALFHCQ